MARKTTWQSDPLSLSLPSDMDAPPPPPPPPRGYLRMPSVSGERLAFVCEDDVSAAWLGRPREPPVRLTLDQCCEHPLLSPDAALVAFTSHVRRPAR